jgi:entericidin B
MRTIKKTVVLVAIAALLSMTTLGCNTFKGAGKDIERGGEKIQGAADGAQDG